MKHLLLSVMYTFFALQTLAQWEFTRGPYGGRIQSIAQDTTGNLYAFKDILSWAFYKSTDNGQTWFDNGSELELGGHEMLIHPNGSFFLKSRIKVFRSDDSGESWQELNIGTIGNFGDMVISSDGSIFLLNGGNLLCISHNLGETWSVIEFNTDRLYFMTMDSDGDLFCTGSNYNYLLTSQDGGLSWDSIPKNASLVKDFDSDSYGRLVIIEEHQVLRSADGGYSWNQIFNSGAFDLISLDDGQILLSANNGVLYKSYDDGITWNEIKINAYYTGFYQLQDESLFATSDQGLYISFDLGETWNSRSTGIIESELNSVAANVSGTIITTTSGNFVELWRYNETDDTWISVMEGINGNAIVQYSGGYFWLLENGRVHRSLDGEEWTLLQFPRKTNVKNLSCFGNGNCVFLNYGQKSYWSNNFGDDLILIENNLPSGTNVGNVIHLSEDSLILVTYRHDYKNTNIRSTDIFLSINEGYTWTKICELDFDESIGWDADIIRDRNNNLYIVNVYYNVLLASSDNGFTWNNINHQGEVHGIFTANDDYLYANLDFRRLERTKDFGETWELYMDGLPAGPSLPFNSGTGSESGFIYVHIRDVYYKGMQDEHMQVGVYKRNTLSDITSVLSNKVSDLNIYPNPTTGFFTIDYPDYKLDGSTVVNMFDISGRMVKEIKINSTRTVIDISNLAPGTYFLSGTALIIE